MDLFGRLHLHRHNRLLSVSQRCVIFFFFFKASTGSSWRILLVSFFLYSLSFQFGLSRTCAPCSGRSLWGLCSASLLSSFGSEKIEPGKPSVEAAWVDTRSSIKWCLGAHSVLGGFIGPQNRRPDLSGCLLNDPAPLR